MQEINDFMAKSLAAIENVDVDDNMLNSSKEVDKNTSKDMPKMSDNTGDEAKKEQ